MESRSLLVLSGAVVVFLAARASCQSFEDPTKFYKNMTFEFDVRHRGEVGIPSCVKQLMECWDIIRSDVTCSHRIFYETACSVMRNLRCNEFAPFGEYGQFDGQMQPYKTFQIFEQYCPDKGIGTWTRRRRLPAATNGATTTTTTRPTPLSPVLSSTEVLTV